MEMEPGKLFIGGISWDTSEERLKDYFETFGEVKEAVIMKDRTTGRARGFGFIVFVDASVAEKVVKERHIIDGRTVSHASLFVWHFAIGLVLHFFKFICWSLTIIVCQKSNQCH